MSNPSDESNLTEREEIALLHLARRQRETESEEARGVHKAASKSTTLQNLWAMLLSVVSTVVFCTAYVTTINHQVEQTSNRLNAHDLIIDKFRDKLEDLRLQLERKADRK
jgi:preprotein translocase subunit SecY